MNISDVNPILWAAKKTNDSVLMRGLHGIGKSEVISQYCLCHNLFLKTIFLSMFEVGDLLGIPHIQVNKNGISQTVWAAPDWLVELEEAAWPSFFSIDDLVFEDKNFEMQVNKDINSKEELTRLYNNYYKTSGDSLTSNQMNVRCKLSRETVLFTDEFSRAQTDVHNACLQLILEKKLHNHILPFVNGQQTQIIAGDNPSNLDYHVNDLDPASLDRFLLLDVEVDVQSWLKWARENNVNIIVRDFISNNVGKLHFTPTDKLEIGSTPRSLTKLAAFVDIFDELPEESLFNIIRGKIGSTVGAQFYTFYNNYSKNISTEDIEIFIVKAYNNQDELDLEDLGIQVKDLLKEIESITKLEHVNALYEKYCDTFKETETEDIFTLLAILYSLDIEVLASFLKDKKNNDKENFYALMMLDPNKSLARRIKSKVVAAA